MLRTIAKTAGTVLDALTANLEVGGGRTINNADGSFMAVNVTRTGEHTFAVSHRYEQNGDLVPDPDMEFVKTERGWMPLAIEQWSGRRVALRLKADGLTPGRYNSRVYSDCLSFTSLWMRNIKWQQGGLKDIRAAAKAG